MFSDSVATRRFVMFGALDNGQLDMPDYEHMEDEAFPLVPPPLSPGGGDLEGNALADGEGEVSKLPEVPAAKRRTVKRPQPKLDSQRLLSERGLPALRTLFDNVKFKGKGHESEDLKVLLQKMENWAHRLYPKLQFEDFIDKLEVLGGKKEVQTCLKRIRLDMPLTHEDFVGQNDDEADSRLQEDTDPFGDGGFSEDPFVHSTPAPAPAPAPLSLTEEQHKRIQLNKQLALERRLARQKQQDESVGSPGHHLSQDNQEDLDRNTGKNSSPLKHNPSSLPENSHLRDECESPIPELTSQRGENAD